MSRSLAQVRRAVLIASALGALVFPASAQTPGDQGNALLDQLKALLQQEASLQARVSVLVQKKKDLDWGAEQFKIKFATLEQDRSNLRQREIPIETSIERHNDHQPDPGCPPCVAAYNQEGSSLESQKAAFRSDEDAFNQRAALLENLRQTLSDQTLKWASDVRELQGKTDDNHANIRVLRGQLVEQEKRLSACQAALHDNSLEHVREVCGQSFDANSLHSSPHNQGTGNLFPKPNSSASQPP